MKILSKLPILRKIINNRNQRYFITACFGFILFFSISVLPGLARDTPKFHILDNQPQELAPSETVDTPAAKPSNLDNDRGFAAFADDFFTRELSESKIPGAIISVVKDGEIFFTKGYGYANLEEQIPVSADKTLFRVASLSKLFTATAAMQLYERNALDLNSDVSGYLEDWQLENPYPEAVTPARMMMHTDGTTQRLIGLGADTKAEMQPLEKYLPEYMPAINYPPGKFYSYSNHSIALLGYLVEKISGIPFTEYIDKNIFQPLTMNSSTFRQPPVSELPRNFATGYQIRNGEPQPVPYLYLNIAPAAALTTTATDMAHFMLAHLQNGSYQNSQILQPETTELMHQTHYQVHPLLPGTGYGFRERLINDIRTIGHLGSLRGYSSSLTLIPQENVGIFIASNCFSGIHDKFIDRFFARYFPEQSNSQTPYLISLSSQELKKYTGTYRDMEYPRSTIAKITGVAKQIQVTSQSDGTLLVQTPPLFFFGKTNNTKLIPTSEPRLFRRQKDDAYVFFIANESGKITHVSNPLYAKIGTFQRVPWYENIKLHLALLAFCSLWFILATVTGLNRAFQLISGNKSRYNPKLNITCILATSIAILNLIFLVGLPLYLWLWGGWKLVYGVPPVVVGLFSLPIITTLLSLILVVLILIVWSKNYWTWQERSHYSLITLAAIAFIPLLAYWNLLGWQF